MKKSLTIVIISLIFLSCKDTNEDLFNKGYQLSRKGKYQEAILVYNKLIKRNNKMQAAFYSRGFCYQKLRDYKSAFMDYNMVVWLKTRGGQFIITLNENSSFADEEAKTQVDYYDALYQRGQASYYIDSLKISYKDFKTLVQADYTEKSNCFIWLGCILLRHANYSEACNQFQQAKATAANKVDIDIAETYLKTNCR